MLGVLLLAAGHSTPTRLRELQSLDTNHRTATLDLLEFGFLTASGPVPIPDSEFEWLRSEDDFRYGKL